MNEKMNAAKITVYHGSNALFNDIDLSRSGDKRDFGVGFYTTSIAAQAESWARTKKLRQRSERAYVYVYEVQIPPELAVKQYDGLSIEWLEMVKTNRVNGGVQHDYDIVIGPVANDDTMLTVVRYVDGIYTAEEAIRRLKYAKVNDQVSFHTSEAIRCLSFNRRYSVDE